MNERQLRILTNESVYRIEARLRRRFGPWSWWGRWVHLGHYPDHPDVWVAFEFDTRQSAESKVEDLKTAHARLSRAWHPVGAAQ